MMMRCYFAVRLIALLCVCASGFRPSNIYPAFIPVYKVRIDDYTKDVVQSGLLHTLPANNTLAEFKRHLQCPLREPNFNYNSGLVSMMRLCPPTSDSIKLVCSYIEKKCDKWDDCRRVQQALEAGNRVTNWRWNELNQFSFGQLLRVINSTLYYDWPWGIERFNDKVNENTLAPLIKMTLDRITDMRDSVFFISGDQPNIPYHTIMPMFSHSTAESFADLVWPWFEMWQDATKAYKVIRQAKLNFTNEAFEQTEPGYLPWDQKVPKAAYFATIFRNRQFMYDVARLHPDLFDAKFNGELLPPAEMKYFQPWHPLSTEVWNESMYHSANATKIAAAQSLPPGYVLPLLNLTELGHNIPYKSCRYKYVVVPVGAGFGLSTSARLQHILSHSGAVVLLQSSSYRFHISAQFKPWVHYVPISFSGADVAEKVQWLREHDDMARQIAENGRNFARSYLRLEDFYCYAAAALDMMAELTGKTDATNVTFSPRPIQPMQIRFGDVAAQEYPV